jgi:membrane-associated phospholipid phosphatase
MVQFASLGLINFFWLVSFHTTAMTATLMISLLLFGIWTLAITVPLLILVAAVRLYLRRHSSAQVLGGVALGASTVILMVAFGCFTDLNLTF